MPNHHGEVIVRFLNWKLAKSLPLPVPSKHPLVSYPVRSQLLPSFLKVECSTLNHSFWCAYMQVLNCVLQDPYDFTSCYMAQAGLNLMFLHLLSAGILEYELPHLAKHWKVLVPRWSMSMKNAWRPTLFCLCSFACFYHSKYYSLW